MTRPAPSPDRYLTPPAVAARLGVSPEQVLGWVRRGELRGYDLSEKRGGRCRIKISPEALEAFLVARAVVPSTRPTRRKSSRPDWVKSWV